MSQPPGVQELFHAARSLRGAAAACFLVAAVALVAFDGGAALVLAVALALVGTVLWLRGQPRRLQLEDELAHTLDNWVAAAEGEEGLQQLRHAFRLCQQALTAGPSGHDVLRESLRVFEDHLAREHKEGASWRQGLVASAVLHRARARRALGDADGHSLESIRRNLLGFEERFARWPVLVLPALALRMELALATGNLTAAEEDQILLDHLPQGRPREKNIVELRRLLADRIWEESRDPEQRHRAMVHYEAWLGEVEDEPLAAAVMVARRHAEQGDHGAVIHCLRPAMERDQGRSSTSRRHQFEANRLLGQAFFRRNDLSNALRCYNVLMSIADPANPYLRDKAVLEEVRQVEEALQNKDRPEEE